MVIFGKCLTSSAYFVFVVLFYMSRKGDQAMPVLDTERRAAGRSALRYRPIDTDQAYAGPVVPRARRSRPDTLTTTARVEPDGLDQEEENYPPRQRSTSMPVMPHKIAPPARAGNRFHPLFFVGLGLLTTILLWIGVTQLLIWGTNEYNTIVYGYPRTFQADAVVGQDDSPQHPSHFIAVNLHGTITIIEFPGGDPARARELISSSVLGPGGDLAVVTLHFVDINQNGHPDMVIDVGGVQSLLVNDGKTFRPPTLAEQQRLLLYLQQHP